MSTDQQPDATGHELSVGEVAAKLGCSRPYAVMLCDRGKLGDIVVTAEGQRRIHVAAVDAYLAQRTAENMGTSDYMQVAQDLGMYDIPEEDCIDLSRPTTDKRSDNG
jgi:excisionase family DNA binding protein